MRSNYLISELARRHRVDLLALNQANLLRSYFDSNETGLEAARTALEADLDHMETFDFESPSKEVLAFKSLFTEFPYSVAWFSSRAMASAISERLRKVDYDLVHFDTVGLAQYRHLVTDGTATVLDHHNIESHMMLRRARKEGNPLKKLYYYQEGLRLRQYEKQVLPLFDAHITCSDTDSERLQAICSGLDMRTIANPVRVDTSFSPKREDRQSNRLLFIGGMDWYPNRSAMLHFLQEIWPRLIGEKPDLEVHIIGKNPDPELSGLAAREKGVFVHGFVDDIDSYYRASDVFVCPIHDGGGTKLKVLDAMAHRMPVVGYPEACRGIDVENGLHAHVAHSAQEFAEQVLSLLASPAAAERMGQKAQQLVAEKYEVGKVGEDLSNYYMEVAQR